MEGAGIAIVLAIVVLVVVGVVVSSLRRQRKRAANLDLEDKSWLRAGEAVSEPAVRTAPVREFHVQGNEARITFDVPLPDDDDPVLNDLLVDEGVEVVREKRHTLPIHDIHEIVVFAGRDQVREVGRTRLPSPGELPPPIESEVFNLTHVAKDPFASQFEDDHAVHYGTAVQVPEDELRPIREELRVPLGLDRGLRARGVDPDALSGPEFILALLQMFGYTVVPQGEPNVYVATKGGVQTFIRTEVYTPGDHPELSESVVRKFNAEFATSGAHRGLLITDKYGPFMTHEIEAKEPRIRFVSRERTQAFIDSMALG